MSKGRIVAALAALGVLVVVGAAVAALGLVPGRIGPDSRIQPSGRKLTPAGRLTQTLGNFPAGGALTPDGRFLWTLSAGRHFNDVRIVAIDPPGPKCRKGRRGRACRRRHNAKVGKVVQVIPMPGLSGGMAFSPDGRTAYVSGTPDSAQADQHVGADVPCREGDCLHVLSVDPKSGLATRAGTIALPPPSSAPTLQDFPPNNFGKLSWPRDIAVSPDGSKLLVALNLADNAAIVDTKTKAVRYVKVDGYPYGAAILADGKTGLVSNEVDGLVDVIDLDAGTVSKRLSVGPHLSHPEAIAVDPKAPRAFVAVANQDLVAEIDTKALEVRRTLSVSRPQGLGTSPTALSVTPDGRRLLVSDSGEDAVAVFGLPAGDGAPTLLGKVPVAAYPTGAWGRNHRLVWLSGKGLGVGPNPNGPRTGDPRDSDQTINAFQYLPSLVTGVGGLLRFPGPARLKRYTPLADRQILPSNAEKPPAGSPIAPPGPSQQIKHVFYVVKENRSYDQELGDDERGDGDPKLTLFGNDLTPNIHALVRRFPLLDHVYANSEASIDGHFWTSAGSVSDYVVKAWMANYAARQRPYDFGVYSVTWPAPGFLFDQAEKQGISWFNFGEAVAGTVPLNDRNRSSADTQRVVAKFNKSDLGTGGCFGNDASIGKDAVAGAAGRTVEIYDSTPPPTAPLGSMSRFDCFKRKFDGWVSSNSVPAFVYATFSNDHTEGTTPGRRTPQAMVAENDYGVGQLVDLISHSPIWNSSLIEIIEDDSQDGADHVDAHRIPALVISPWTRRGAVVHTRYDFLSFIRTLEQAVGMKPLGLFDATAVPLYDAFDTKASNAEPYTVIPPKLDIDTRNAATAPAARESARLQVGRHLDEVPQEELDKILWQAVHGAGSHPPPPGPNAVHDRGPDADG